jgi:hypothetical protein
MPRNLKMQHIKPMERFNSMDLLIYCYFLAFVHYALLSDPSHSYSLQHDCHIVEGENVFAQAES